VSYHEAKVVTVELQKLIFESTPFSHDDAGNIRSYAV